MSSPTKITLNKKQIAFVVEMTEIKDPVEAVRHFALIMAEEKVSASNMSAVIDRIMERNKKK